MVSIFFKVTHPTQKSKAILGLKDNFLLKDGPCNFPSATAELFWTIERNKLSFPNIIFVKVRFTSHKAEQSLQSMVLKVKRGRKTWKAYQEI